ncbi:lipopolysaccharide biosynthesis protein [Arthrobacter castelli]|uniref:lipopolysaccharide biosynthesis protein n=1 Tax=Arthrobacter castelli TaxID=271431 RepID=UPI00042404E7|nr:oligosaccharide flippase family protein [Arthrobacter castelli]
MVKLQSGQPRRLSLRRNFSWNFAGTVTYNLAQWLLLVILAHVAGAAQVGLFSLMLAISAPVFLTVGLNLRVLQVTDASRFWRLSEYLALRHILNLLAVLLTVAAGAIAGLHGEELFALVIIALAKCVEAVSQTYYAYFQQHDRLDLVARDLVARSATGPILFLIGVAYGGNLVFGASGLLVGWLIPQLLLDRPNARRLAAQGGLALRREGGLDWRSMVRLARKGVPLGLDQGLSSLAINIPRYAVQGVLGPASLGIYATLAYLAQTVQLITSTLTTAAINRLSIHHYEGRKKAFLRLLTKLTAFGMAVMAVAILGAFLLGEPFLQLVLGEQYADRSLLIALMLSAGVTTFQRALCKGVEAARRFKTYVLVDIATTAGVAGLSWYCVERWGLEGAAVAMAGGFGIGIIVVGVVLFDVVRKMPKVAASEVREEPGS